MPQEAPHEPPDTIVLVHGFWVTPRSWEHWIAHYEARATGSSRPAYPGFEVEVEALNEDPTPIVDLDLKEVVARLEGVIGELDQPPIIIGPLRRRRDHADPARPRVRRRGRRAELGADRGRARSRRGRRSRSTSPILHNPSPTGTRPIGFTLEQWEYAFTNGLPRS